MARSKITIRDPLTLATAFRFPVQHAVARRELMIGGLLVFIPVIGWMLNMGHRLELVHRMQNGREPWPAWGNFPRLLRHGFVTTAAIVFYHLPAAGVLAAAYWTGLRGLYAVGVTLWLVATFLLPGFMTFYAKAYDIREIVFPGRAVRRAFQGGRAYLLAWGIGIVAVCVSFLGLALAVLGFAFTSVWFWQVAAFCFSSVFSRQHGLISAATLTPLGWEVGAKGGSASASITQPKCREQCKARTAGAPPPAPRQEQRIGRGGGRSGGVA